jgi:dihydrofolate reductase
MDRKIIVSLHVSLDGFVAGPDGEMDWIKVNEELFDFIGERTAAADTALYGRKTWEMMDSYWPAAGKQQEASRHDIEHSQWYNSVRKIVISKSLTGREIPNTTIVGDNISQRIKSIRNEEGKDIIVFGSPSAVHMLMENELIDEYWLFVNPVVIGKGIPCFKPGSSTSLKFRGSKDFQIGVAALHYVKPA